MIPDQSLMNAYAAAAAFTSLTGRQGNVQRMAPQQSTSTVLDATGIESKAPNWLVALPG
jgi:hypothetical protein